MKKPFLISALCAALVIVLLLLGFSSYETPAPQNRKTYGAVLQTDTGTFVMQLKKGMQQAAEELNLQLTIYTQSQLPKAAELDGAVLWLDQPDTALNLLRESGLSPVVVGQRREDAVCVLSDDENAGRQLIAYALQLASPEQIVLLRDDEDEHSRRRGAAAAQWGKFRTGTVLSYTPGMALPGSCRLVVAVSQRASREIAQRKEAGEFTGLLLGVDTGDSRVSYLESGVMQAIALDSPYAMGYLALYKANELTQSAAVGNALTKVLLATQENMYLSQNVKQVFPLLH